MTYFRHSAIATIILAATFGASAQEGAPAKFAPQAAAQAVLEICAEAGFSGASTPAAHGLTSSVREASVAWALQPDAALWRVDSRDGEVLLYAYGPDQTKCGVVISFTVPEGVRSAVAAELETAGGYTVASESELSPGVNFVRMFNADTARYVDIVDYPSSAKSPGLVKIELLSN